MRWSLIRASLVFLFFVLGGSAAGQSYDIVLGRPVAVGATYAIAASATSEENVVITRGEETVQEVANSIRVEIAATATVLEIDEVSQPLSIRFVVERCSIQRDGESLEPFSPGTAIVATIGADSKRFTVDDQPVKQDVAAALSLIHSLTSSDETNDEIFGTSEKKKVGDTWPLATERSAKGLTDLGLPVSEGDISGKATLVEVTKDGEGEALRIEGDLTVRAFTLPEIPGFRVDSASMTARFSGRFPVDPSRRKLDERLEGAMHIEATEAAEGEGPRMRLVASGKRTSEARYADAARE